MENFALGYSACSVHATHTAALARKKEQSWQLNGARKRFLKEFSTGLSGRKNVCLYPSPACDWHDHQPLGNYTGFHEFQLPAFNRSGENNHRWETPLKHVSNS